MRRRNDERRPVNGSNSSRNGQNAERGSIEPGMAEHLLLLASPARANGSDVDPVSIKFRAGDREIHYRTGEESGSKMLAGGSVEGTPGETRGDSRDGKNCWHDCRATFIPQ